MGRGVDHLSGGARGLSTGAAAPSPAPTCPEAEEVADIFGKEASFTAMSVSSADHKGGRAPPAVNGVTVQAASPSGNSGNASAYDREIGVGDVAGAGLVALAVRLPDDLDPGTGELAGEPPHFGNRRGSTAPTMDRLGSGVWRPKEVRLEPGEIMRVQMHGTAQQHLGNAGHWSPTINGVDGNRQRHVAADADFERRRGAAADAAAATEPALDEALIVYPHVDRLRRRVLNCTPVPSARGPT